ncbi:unnamed protein product [Polarella glacialis]|uniref:Uncharacterized protein n=1 Tax=Polarella glacialis TaxID=89957 RepID=A0A813H904_POLGL|nr:unnamed protein product [Polarella glacialis]
MLQIRLQISEGRYHIVKRMLQAVGLSVCKLHREAVGCISCESLQLRKPQDAALVPASQALELLASCGLGSETSEGRDTGMRARAIYNSLRCGRLLCLLRRGVELSSDAPRLESWLQRHWTLQGPCLAPLRALCPGIVAPCLCEAPGHSTSRIPTY